MPICCVNHIAAEFNLKHASTPIALSADLLEAIEMLLWYVPEIQSYQSDKSSFSYEIISKPIYDEFCFDYLLESIGFDKSNVICCPSPPELNAYQKDSNPVLCANCEELILHKVSSRTKTSCLLNHLRNCIAHGRFNLHGELLIGLDFQGNQCTALIKINPRTLLHALRALESGITKEALFSYALTKAGYQIITQPSFDNTYSRFDILVEKSGRKYAVEIKSMKCRYVPHERIVAFANNCDSISANNFSPVLIIDDARLLKESKEFLLSKNIIIKDISSVRDLLNKKDIFA